MRVLDDSEFCLVAGGMMVADSGGDGDGYDYGGGGGDYIPPIDFTIEPIDFGGLDTSFEFVTDSSQVTQIDISIDSGSVEMPIMSTEAAAAIANAATAACSAVSKKWTGAVGCSVLGSAIEKGLNSIRTSENAWTATKVGAGYSMRYSMN